MNILKSQFFASFFIFFIFVNVFNVSKVNSETVETNKADFSCATSILNIYNSLYPFRNTNNRVQSPFVDIKKQRISIKEYYVGAPENLYVVKISTHSLDVLTMLESPVGYKIASDIISNCSFVGAVEFSKYATGHYKIIGRINQEIKEFSCFGVIDAKWHFGAITKETVMVKTPYWGLQYCH
jgi:hypothetical protein